jgi:anaerobic magnesium-protoporphyrin IX monomethyl ester cyclase
MKALLIVHDNYQEDNHFPIATGYVAAELVNDGVEVETYCMDVYHYTNNQLANKLKKEEYDIIGLGFFAARYKETIKELCEVINKYKKKAWLVLGGYGPSPIPEFILNDTKCDCVVVGEFENVVHKLVKDRESNNNEIIYKENPTKKLDEIPFPAWDLFPMDIYKNNIIMAGMNPTDRYMNMVTSRGCVNKCSFCYRMEKGIRLRSIDNIVEEIYQLNKRFGTNFIEFSDECYVLNKSRIERFTQALDERNLKIKYWCASRVNIIDEDMLDLLKKSGCEFINYGFESMDEKVLKGMNKNTTPEQNENAARLTKEAGIPFGLNFLWCNPYDTIESLWKNVNFIKKYNTYKHIRNIRPVTPFPGCDLYYYAINKGLLDGPRDFFNKFKNSDMILVNFTDLDVKDMYNEMFKANKELIIDHFKNTNKDMDEAMFHVESIKKVYFEGDTKFRGLRHYERKI